MKTNCFLKKYNLPIGELFDYGRIEYMVYKSSRSSSGYYHIYAFETEGYSKLKRNLVFLYCIIFK